MNENTLRCAYELHELISTDERVLNLNHLEKEMMDDLEVQSLSKNKDEKNEKYLETIRYFGEKSLECASALKEFYLAKKALEEHPKVRDYLKAYQQVRLLFNEINHILFDEFNENLCPTKKN